MSRSIESPITIALATVPKPGGEPASQLTATSTRPTHTTALPNDSGVCSDTPMWNTSHGGSPSSDSSMSTIAKATTTSPANNPTSRIGTRPRSSGASLNWHPRRQPNGLAGSGGPADDPLRAYARCPNRKGTEMEDELMGAAADAATDAVEEATAASELHGDASAKAEAAVELEAAAEELIAEAVVEEAVAEELDDMAVGDAVVAEALVEEAEEEAEESADDA